MRAKRKKRSRASSPSNEGAQMSNELESARAMVANLRFRITIGADGHGVGYYETETVTDSESPSSTNPH